MFDRSRYSRILLAVNHPIDDPKSFMHHIYLIILCALNFQDMRISAAYVSLCDRVRTQDLFILNREF